MISIRQFETTRMYTNTYICFDEDTREGFILDVGECTEDILSYIKRNNIKIRYIILTISCLMLSLIIKLMRKTSLSTKLLSWLLMN